MTLAVSDNGRRMEPSAVDRGHGLGLAIVDSDLRPLGGSVQLRSELGVGTWVWLRLPRIPPGAEGVLEARGMPRRQDVPRDTGT